MKKIIISTNEASNILNHRDLFLKKLLEKNFEVHIISKYNQKNFEKLEKMGCIPHKIFLDRKGINPLKDIKTVFQYFLLFKKISPDYLFNFTIKPVIYGSFVSSFLKIKTANVITGMGTAFVKKTFLTSLVKIFYKISQKKVEKIFFENKDDLEFFKKEKLAKKEILQLIPGSGVNLKKFPFSEKEYLENEFSFLFVGRILKDKGILELVEASKKLEKFFPNKKIKIDLLGPIDEENKSGISKKKLLKLIENSPVEYLGQTENTLSFIKKSDCIVLPSFYREGIPVSLLEAMAVGRAIITTDAIGCKDIIKDGKNGFQAKVRDINSLFEAMKKFVNLSVKEKKEMSKFARKFVEKNYDRKKVTEIYFEIL